MFGISTTRLVLYGVVLIALIGANLWRLSDDEGATAPAPPVATIVAALPDLTLGHGGEVSAPSARDLFRRPGTEPVVAAPPPPPPPRKIQPVNEWAEQIDLANEILDGYRVVGILRIGGDMVATFERDGLIVTVKRGERLPEGFVARHVAIDHVILAHDGLAIERRFQEGVLDGD